MDLVILCGGKGKRLKKITKKLPKPLLKINKVSFLQILINYYQNSILIKFIYLLDTREKNKRTIS